MEVKKPRKKSSIFESIRNSRLLGKIKKKLRKEKPSREQVIRKDSEIEWNKNPDPNMQWGYQTQRGIIYNTERTGNPKLAEAMVKEERGKVLNKYDKRILQAKKLVEKKEEEKEKARQKLQGLQVPGAPKLPPMLSHPPLGGGTRRRKRKRRRKTKKKKKRRRRTKKKKKKRRRRTKKRRRK